MSKRTRSRLFPLVGGVTAAATAAGGVAVAQMAPAGAEPASASSALSPSSVLGAGMLESCEAYFGFGKDNGGAGMVEFDVADTSGDDGADHGVDLDGDGDTDVVLVLENEEGDVLECVPFEVTEEMWDAEYPDDSPPFQLLTYPGPGHYAYPSVAFAPELDGFGTVTAAGFRVAGIPADHTLVSPEGVQALDDPFVEFVALFDDEVLDPRVVDVLEEGAEPAAVTAYTTAFEACIDGDPVDFEDPDLYDAVFALGAAIGLDIPADIELDCSSLYFIALLVSQAASATESAAYVEAIRLAVPAGPTTSEPTTTTSTPATPTDVAPAARAVTASPTFTG